LSHFAGNLVENFGLRADFDVIALGWIAKKSDTCASALEARDS
jgi:hypothetical protein